jgi:hypothetical protein
MLAAFIIASTLIFDDPKEILKKVQTHYQALSSFSMDIEHHNSSGLFPGNYKQTLKWQSPKRFELVITQKAEFAAKEGQSGTTAPSYFSDGTYVSGKGGPLDGRSDSVEPRPNSSPGWEVSGGMILSWLMKTPTGNFLFEPPKGFTVSFSFVEATKEWQKIPVREIIASFAVEGSADNRNIQLFVGKETDTLAGLAFSSGNQSGWAKYTNQVENPKFGKAIGGK